MLGLNRYTRWLYLKSLAWAGKDFHWLLWVFQEDFITRPCWYWRSDNSVFHFNHLSYSNITEWGNPAHKQASNSPVGDQTISPWPDCNSGYVFRSGATWHLFKKDHLMKVNCTKLSWNEEGNAEGRPRIRRRSIAPALRAAVWSTQSKTYKHFTHPWSEQADRHCHKETRSRAEEWGRGGRGREAEIPPPAAQDPCSDLCQPTPKCKSPCLRCWPSPGDPQSCYADGAIYRMLFSLPKSY